MDQIPALLCTALWTQYTKVGVHSDQHLLYISPSASISLYSKSPEFDQSCYSKRYSANSRPTDLLSKTNLCSFLRFAIPSSVPIIRISGGISMARIEKHLFFKIFHSLTFLQAAISAWDLWPDWLIPTVLLAREVSAQRQYFGGISGVIWHGFSS